MPKIKTLLCPYCKGTATFRDNHNLIKWGVNCCYGSSTIIRSFDTEVQAQRSINELCFGDGRLACRLFLLGQAKCNDYSKSDDELFKMFTEMEEATVAKQTYYCKCGETFKKGSTAQDTGYRIDDYSPQHKCYGCPFIEPVMAGWGDTLSVKTHECRASAEKVNYATTASMALASDCVAHVYTLDLAWLNSFINFYLDTPGCDRSITDRDPDKLEKAFRNSSLSQGRRSYSFEFEKNKQGRAAKKLVYNKFFDEDGNAYQEGCGLPDKRVRILHMIVAAKEIAVECVERAENGKNIVKSEVIAVQIIEPSEQTCPNYFGTKIKKGGGYLVQCKCPNSAPAAFSCSNDGSYISKMEFCSGDKITKCRSYLYSFLKEHGVEVSSDTSGNELENMYTDFMMKLEGVEKAVLNECPYYKGIGKSYSPRGYYVSCTVCKGQYSILDNKSWAVDAADKRCKNSEQYVKCRFYNDTQLVSTEIVVETPIEAAPAPPQLPLEGVTAIPRTITDVTAEIRFYKAQTVAHIIEIGKRLIEAKAMLEHGQWGDWLKNEVDFSQETANRFMRLANEYPNSSPVTNLSYTNLLALLAVPAEEREEFIDATHMVDGVEKAVDEMSKRELHRVIKERDEAIKQAEQATSLKITISKSYDCLEEVNKKNSQENIKLISKNNELEEDNQRLQAKVKKLESQPIDVAVQQPSDAEMASMRTAIRAEVIKELALPETYLAKKSVEEATSLFIDSVSGSVSNGLMLAMRLEERSAAKMMEAYISTLVQYTQELRERLNLMKAVDRNVKDGAGDVDW